MKNVYVRDTKSKNVVFFPLTTVKGDSLENIMSNSSMEEAIKNELLRDGISIGGQGFQMTRGDLFGKNNSPLDLIKHTVALHISNNLATTNFKRDFSINEIVEPNEDGFYRKDTTTEEIDFFTFTVTTPRRLINKLEKTVCEDLTNEYKDFYKRNKLAEIYKMEDVLSSNVLSSNRKKFIENLAYNCRLRISASLRAFSPISTFLDFELINSNNSNVTFEFKVDPEQLDVGFTPKDIFNALTFKMDGYDPQPARAYTDFKKTYFDLEWVSNLSSAQMLAVYLHELCHPFFRHASRMETLSSYRELQNLTPLHSRLTKQYSKLRNRFETVLNAFKNNGKFTEINEFLSLDENIKTVSEFKDKYPQIFDECDSKSFKECPSRAEDVDYQQIVEGRNVLRHLYLYFISTNIRLHMCTNRINFIRQVSNYAQDVPINELICHIETDKDNSRFFNMSSMWGFTNTYFKERQGLYGRNVLSDTKKELIEGVLKDKSDERKQYIGGLINFSSLRAMFIMKYDRDIADSKHNLTVGSSSEEIFEVAMKIYDEKTSDPTLSDAMGSGLPSLPETMGSHEIAKQQKSEETFESTERKEAFNRTCQSVLNAVQRNGIPGAGDRVDQFQLILGEILENKSYINWKDRIQGELDRFFPARTTYRRLNMHHFVLGEIRPTTYGETLKMNIMVDTSASMFNPVNDAATEIENILLQFDDYEIDFYAVDTDICAHVLFNSTNRYSREEIVKHIKGSGGTDYSTFFKHLIDIDNRNPTLVITDMGFRIMEFTQADIRFPVYWLAVDNTYDLYMKDIKNYVLPFGEVLPMKRF
ncbi:hypothetical protein [Proteus mirabilis]|uniref:hypothetical protein n=1 Tax=Proteus mirabilis TaxID=584 RepID=UPI0034D5FEE1